MISTRRAHVPERTCVGCRRAKHKSDLIRIVSNEGKVKLDLSGTTPGRGAYICLLDVCWEVALKGNRLANALRVQVTQEDKDKLFKIYQDSINTKG